MPVISRLQHQFKELMFWTFIPILAPPTTFPSFNPLATFVNSPTDVKNPESYLYSLSFQREIARQYIVEIGYSGSRSINQVNQLQAKSG